MGSVTWSPAGNSSVNCVPNSGTNWEAVLTDDADTLFVKGVPPNTSPYTQDIYTKSGDPVPAGATNISITVTIKVKASGALSIVNAQAGLSSSGTISVELVAPPGIAAIDPAAYESKTHTLTNDPATSAAWTVTGINAILLVMRVSASANTDGRCTYVTATVTYTDPPANSGMVLMIYDDL